MNKTIKIGILGGTFNPIHYGHLRIAIESLELMDLDQIRFIPCKTPVHKKELEATALQRAKMVELAIQGEDHFILDRREIDRDTPSYMYFTLQSLKNDFPEAELYLILGADALNHFHQWYLPKEILKISHIIAIERPNTESLQYIYNYHHDLFIHGIKKPEEERNTSTGCLFQIKTPHIEISSSDIRHRLKERKKIRYLLPNEVFEYIHEYELYGIKKN
jgi:nicotinate-nucleotide adenylyltransferase